LIHFGNKKSKKFSQHTQKQFQEDEAINQTSSMYHEEKAQDGASQEKSQEKSQEIEIGVEADGRLCLLYLR